MKRTLLFIIVITFYILHQDWWFWRTSRPLAFGVLPAGLWYHACYAVGASLLMWLLVRFAWPGHLESELEPDEHPHQAPKDGQPH